MATLITYQNLKDARDNGTLAVGTEYEVSDYPTFHPIVEATAADELSEAGRTANGWTLLYSVDSDNPNPPAGFKGLIIYLSDGNNSAWYDWKNEANILNSSNIRIGPTYDSDGYRCAYGGTILQSANVTIYGAGSLNVTVSQNIIVGSGNTGTISHSSYVTVGQDNTNLSITNVTGCQVGDNNTYITVTANDTEIGDNNANVTLSGGSGSVGYGNRSINVTSEEFEIENECLKVDISAKYNKVSKTQYSDIKAPYNTVKDSNSVELVDSVGNAIESSRLVYLRDVNNNDIYTSEYIIDKHQYTLPTGETVQYNIPDPQPFVRVRPNNWQKPYRVVENMIDGIANQADNFGVVVNKTTQERQSNSVTQRYYLADGVWTLDDVQTATGFVTMLMPKSESSKVAVTGWGEYTVGTTATLDFSYVASGWFARFVDGNGVQHSAPYSFIVSKDTQVSIALIQQPDDEIWYTSSDSQAVTPYNSSFGGASITSNTYSNGLGIIKFDQDLTTVGYEAFRGCSTLAHIYLPATVTTIGDYTFYGTGLTSLTVPAAVTSVGHTVFGKTSLNSLVVESGNGVYDSRDNCNAIIETSTNTLKVGCTASAIPSGVTSVESMAFDDVQTLTAITFPASVTSLGWASFNSCLALAEITLLGTSGPSAGSAFTGSFPANGTVYGQAGGSYSSFMSALPAGWTLVQ